MGNTRILLGDSQTCLSTYVGSQGTLRKVTPWEFYESEGETKERQVTHPGVHTILRLLK